MMTSPKRTTLLSLSAAAALAVAVTPTAIGAGGLSLSPAVVEHAAKVGSVGTVVVDNSSATPLKITVTPRPWKQALSGAVAPDKKKTLLSQVGVSARSFTLAAGTKKSITLTLKHGPSGGALYGSVDVVGLPTAAAKKKTSGVIPGYRLIGSLRLTPSSKKLSVRVGSAAVKGKSIVVAVRNTGNTIDPVSGRVRISGARGSRTVTVAATKVLPGSIVDLPLGSVKGLPKGSYTAKVSLSQGGKSVASTSKAFKIG
jgi:hypothetical protein